MSSLTLDDHLAATGLCWKDYRSDGRFESFVEFTLALNGLAECLSRLRLPGLVRQCEELENAALALFGDPDTHPIAEQSALALERQIEGLLGAIRTARHPPGASTQQTFDVTGANRAVEWIKPRTIWMIAPKTSAWASSLAEQLTYYGFRVHRTRWGCAMPDIEAPFAVLFLPATDSDGSESVRRVSLQQVTRVRERCPVSQLFYIGVPRTLDAMVTLMRAGIDYTVQRDDRMASLLSRILDMVQTREQERYRVLIVDDSRVAVTQIQRALEQRDIHSCAIPDPTQMFEMVDNYRPDLVLMDMHMPNCNGVEATRALRQLPAYQAMPIIYLSGETNVALQVDALRLGGDQFMTKPFNPVLLAATVKTTIERHREMQRASRHDGLTGLLNHTAAKADLDARLRALSPKDRLCVMMIDIDRFKSVNDTYGHPVGDQVIRSLAWLFKGRLRSTDMIGRYGGEEFIIATPDVDLDRAYAVIDQIRAHFSNLPHAHTEGVLRVTFSAGIAAYPEFATTKDLIDAADGALLEAKRLGRNRVERAQGDR
jgi:diguanylate cyclase (GGDEF)-like protein